MSILNRKQYQRGVGLIEVLIALVVIGVGFIAIMGLQGTLMSGSATTKARNEAVALAREKTEELRNAIELDQFDTDLGVQGLTVDPDYKDGVKVADGSGNGKLNGVNAQFTRSWGVVDVTSVENTIELVMQVTWEDAQGADNEVKLNTLIAYASPLNSALSQHDDGPIRPGGTDTGYEGLHGETPDDSDRIEGGGSLTASDESFGIADILRYSNSGHVQVRTWDELCAEPDKVRDSDSNPIKNEEDEFLCVVFTAFGGTLLRFGGTAYVDKYLSNENRDDGFDAALLVKATSPAYCAHQRKLDEECESIDRSLDCIEYLCYASGDCTDTAAGVNGCPTASAAVAALPDLNGGWYGKIGYYFPEQPNSNFPTVCMSKYETVDNGGDPVLDDYRKVARSYYSLRTINSEDWREGINQSYSCHNTLIIDKSYNPNANSACYIGYDKLISEGIVWNSFKDHKVIRELASGDPNDVLGTDPTYCDIVAIYGDILFDVAPEDLPVIDSGKDFAGVKDTLDTLIMDSSGDGVDGECVFIEGNDGIDYACNYVGDPWQGNIVATGTRTYTVGTVQLVIDPLTGLPVIDPVTELPTGETEIVVGDPPELVVYDCEVSVPHNKTADRYPDQHVTLVCTDP